MENTVFFEPKSWWKYGIYWLLESSCFELFGDGKYGLFWGKKVMERWYLLFTEKFLFWAIEKFLFWTFRWWEIRSFFRPKSWCRGNICSIFLSFPWYSRTSEIRFFVQRDFHSIMLEKLIIIGDFDLTPDDKGMKEFVDLHNSINLLKVATCFKWTGSCIS